MELAYLVGQISPKHEITYQWRKDVINYFIDEPSINFINPCANPFNKKVLDRGKYAVTKDKRSFGIDVLPPKDLTFVKRSSCALVNLNHFDKDKPLLGSFFELAWYFLHPEKTVIAFADDLYDYTCQHPFVQQAVHTWCDDWEQACYVLQKYFLSEG